MLLSVKPLTMTFERSVAVLKKGNIVIVTALLGGIFYEVISRYQILSTMKVRQANQRREMMSRMMEKKLRRLIAP